MESDDDDDDFVFEHKNKKEKRTPAEPSIPYVSRFISADNNCGETVLRDACMTSSEAAEYYTMFAKKVLSTRTILATNNGISPCLLLLSSTSKNGSGGFIDKDGNYNLQSINNRGYALLSIPQYQKPGFYINSAFHHMAALARGITANKNQQHHHRCFHKDCGAKDHVVIIHRGLNTMLNDCDGTWCTNELLKAFFQVPAELDISCLRENNQHGLPKSDSNSNVAKEKSPKSKK